MTILLWIPAAPFRTVEGDLFVRSTSSFFAFPAVALRGGRLVIHTMSATFSHDEDFDLTYPEPSSSVALV